MNIYLRDNYNLTGFTRVAFCTSNKEKNTIDTLDATFLGILLSIVLLVGTATYYDSFILNTKNDTSHYHESIRHFCKYT